MASASPAADHRVHGLGTALEPPAWAPIEPGEAERVLAGFAGVGTLAALSWHSPRPFSAATLLRTDAGAFLLKRHHRRLRPADGLAEEHRFMAHLRGAGLPVPEVMAARDGSGAVTLGDWCYELHRQSPGLDLYRDRPSWTPFLIPAHAHAAGATLARLHRAARGFGAPARGPRPLVASLTILPAPDPLAAAEAFVIARPALAGFLASRPWRRQLAALWQAFGEGLPARLSRQSPLWTHNDWHPSNLLWGEDGAVRTVFDFGLSDRTCALADLATAIERSAIAWLRLPDGSDDLADFPATAALLDGYRSVLPLSADDLATVARLLPLVHVEFALAEVDYFHGLLGREDQAAVAWDGYLLGHTDWFGTSAGRDLLRRIERG